MSKPKLTLIKGGLCGSVINKTKAFVSAYITNTRLMGVTCMYIHWVTDEEDLHQFFYFDAEEHGFETYRSVKGNDMAQIVIVEQSLVGGLGGKEIDISEREAKHLLMKYTEFNKEKGLNMPPGEEEYGFMLRNDVNLTLRERETLMKKECVEIESDYQAINYFLMRCFGKDYEAAAFLSTEDVDIDIYKEYAHSSFYRNTIDRNEDGTYMCESLIESMNKYYLLISQLTVKDSKICDFKRCSGFKVSSAEAAMMLSRPEFVTVYDILTTPEIFDMSMMELSLNTMMTSHENGRFYMIFNKNNDHVNKKNFKMSEDVYGIYYVTIFGELIAAAYSIENIHNLERDLRKSDLSKYLALSAKYEFKEPILYDFVQSDFEEFEDFLEFMQDDFHED